MKIRVACHQPNFCAWYPFFYKMAMVDVFIILTSVQFEKNGFQNRYRAGNGNWVTMPVSHGICAIKDKTYADGQNLAKLNMDWIRVIRDTLGIKTILVEDKSYGNKSTQHLIDNIKNYGNVYVTNPDAKNKYLDEDLMRANGIDVEYCHVPKHLNKHTFDMFSEYGIIGSRNQLPRRSECLQPVNG